MAGALPARLPGKRLLLIGDDNTLAAALEPAKAALTPQYELSVHSLGSRGVRARIDSAEILAEMAQGIDGLVAIGSGTVNDLTKYAAALRHLPYAVIATAASMNGYTAANASLEDAQSSKRSYPAQPPVLAVADTDILATAPGRLTRAGIGDTLCRTVIEADMLLSHLLLDTPYPEAWFARARQHEAALYAGSLEVRHQDAGYLEALATALFDAGDAMTEFGSSAPASQSEHMIVHTMEMKYGSELQHLLHGELVAIASLTMSLLQHRMLLSTPAVKPLPYTPEQFQRQFGKRQAEPLMALYGRKLLNAEQCAEINRRIQTSWPEMRERLGAVMVGSNTLERAFIHSGLNIKSEQLGIAEERYRFACSYAHLTRERFTFLDLAAMNAKRVG